MTKSKQPTGTLKLIGILLCVDYAIDCDSLGPYLPVLKTYMM